MSTSYDISRITQILQIPSRLRNNEDIAYLMSLTSQIDFFKKITEEEKSSEIHKACCQVMKVEERNSGDVIVNFGEKGYNFYIVLSGSASVNIPTKKKVKITLSDAERYKLKNIFLTLDLEEDDVSEISFDSKNKKRREAKILNKVDLISLTTAIQEKKNEDSDNQQINEFCKINDLFQDKLDEEKKIILEFLSKQNPEAKVVEIETEALAKVSIIKEGESFGELSLITNKPRAATIIVEEKIILGVLSKPNFKKILGNLAEKKLTEKIDFLQALPMFSNWSKIALYKLGPYFSRVIFKKNQFVYKEGDPANTVYFVKSGEFKITKIHSELKGVVDTSSLEIKNNGRSNNGAVLRLVNMRKKSIQKQLQLVIKGKNEMIGMEEVLENFDKRIHSCQCISDESEVFCISRDNLTIGITYPETWAQIRDKHNVNYAFFKHRVIQLTKIEEAKKSLDLKSWNKLPINYLGKKETEKLEEPYPNMQKKSVKEARFSSPDKEYKQSSWFTTPEHKRIKSSPSPCQYTNPKRVKTEESPVFKEDRSLIFYNRKIDTRTSNTDSPKRPQSFTTVLKKSTETSPYNKIAHRRVAPPNFLRNHKPRANSIRKVYNAAENLAEKLKEKANLSLGDYSAEMEKRAYKSFFL